MYSDNAKKICEISTVDLSYVVTVKSTLEISQNFWAFSEYMNFNSPIKSIEISKYLFDSLFLFFAVEESIL